MKAAAASVEGGSSARELKRWAKEKVNLGGEREKDTYIARDIVIYEHTMLGSESDEERSVENPLEPTERNGGVVHKCVCGRDRERERGRGEGVGCVEGLLQSPFAVRPWGGWGLAGAEGGETMRRMCN